MIEQLRDFRFPSGVDCGLATVDVRAGELADRLGIDLEHWEEDGLGPTAGFALGPAATPVLVAEREHLVTLDPAHATVIMVDGGEAESCGHRATLQRALALLGLEPDTVMWVPDDPVAWAEDARRRLP